MSKKLLSGLLKKKDKSEEKKENTDSQTDEEVPDELPSLAEDLIEDKKETDTEENKEEKENNTPENLPSLEDEPEEQKEETQAEERKEDETKNIKEEIKPIEEKEKSEEKKEEIPEEEPKVGFFANLLDHIKNHQGSKEKLLSGDLFSRMSNYYELKKVEVKSGEILPTQQKLEKELQKKLEEMQVLEKKWQVQKLALEEDLRFLHEREREIQLKAEELKRLANELNLFNNVKPEEYFHLYNGVVLKNLHDLIDVLEIIDDDTFEHHVKKDKNDFSEWIRHVIKDKNLADKIKKSKTKTEMIEILETEPVISEAIHKEYKTNLSPRKYFWLENGVVIKSLLQLSDALKTMDDELFRKHVNSEKNDIADWIKNKLRIEELGRKLEKTTKKEQMIEILEVYM